MERDWRSAYHDHMYARCHMQILTRAIIYNDFMQIITRYHIYADSHLLTLVGCLRSISHAIICRFSPCPLAY